MSVGCDKALLRRMFLLSRRFVTDRRLRYENVRGSHRCGFRRRLACRLLGLVQDPLADVSRK
ncbi:MAG: hypothetical protein WCB48_08500, partial [Casimicrobiaceae bacterium]